MKKSISVAQIGFLYENPEEHISRIREIIYKNREADLIVFPELILHGHPSPERPERFLYRKMMEQSESLSEEISCAVKEADARVIIGEIKRTGDAFYNAATYIDRERRESYFKTHVHWTEQFIPGDELMVFQTGQGQIGINICFDAAFSEVWRVLALRGAEMIVNISAVPATFPVQYMWTRLAGAAINNQVPVIYANRPGPFFSGHSAVFSPKGEIIAGAGHEETLLCASIDTADTARWREEERIFPLRRPLLYRDIATSHDRGEKS